jgi:uncharacterized protein YndB with AHSA1/START domain
MTTSPICEIRWPERSLPTKSAVFVRNEIVIAAPPEHIWPWLLRAELWPRWYANAAEIHIISHAGPDLRDRSRFRWKKFGVKMTSKVREFEPCRRLAWDARGIGIDAYHGWVLTPREDGSTHVLTEETQNGWLARLGKKLMPTRMSTMHQEWLEALGAQAKTGPPAFVVPAFEV